MVRVWKQIKDNPSGERRWERVASIGTGCGGCGVKAAVDENPKRAMILVANPRYTTHAEEQREQMARAGARAEQRLGGFHIGDRVRLYPFWRTHDVFKRFGGPQQARVLGAMIREGNGWLRVSGTSDYSLSVRSDHPVGGAMTLGGGESFVPKHLVEEIRHDHNGEGANPPRRTLTDDYLSEMIMFGGPEPISRGEAIRQMQAEGTPQYLIDAYMMGADRRREMHGTNPLYMNPMTLGHLMANAGGFLPKVPLGQNEELQVEIGRLRRNLATEHGDLADTIAADLEANQDRYEGFVFSRDPEFWGIILRDIDGGLYNADTLYVLTQKKHLSWWKTRARDWHADEFGWFGWAVAGGFEGEGAMFRAGSEARTAASWLGQGDRPGLVVLRIWWD